MLYVEDIDVLGYLATIKSPTAVMQKMSVRQLVDLISL